MKCRPEGGKLYRGAKGFSLFELLIVLIVISALMSVFYATYKKTIEDSREKMVRFQASTFARAVENLYGQAKIKGKGEARLNGVTVYMNEKGWPAATARENSLKSYNQSPTECNQLWHGIFSNAPETVIATTQNDLKRNKGKYFAVYSINGRICRYELLGNADRRYFFDYDLVTGEVAVRSR